MRNCLWILVLAVTTQTSLANPTLEGTVTDQEGRPVVGARIDIATAAPREGEGLFCPSCYRDCVKWTQTNSEGQFKIAKLDPALKFRLLCVATGKESLVTELVDPRDGFLKLTLFDEPQGVPAKRVIHGRVVNKAGAPIQGALISPYGAKTATRRWYGGVNRARDTVSDSRGNFRIALPVGYEAVDLEVTADGYAGTSVALIAPGLDVKEIVVPVGTSVRGRVAYNGQAGANLRVAVVQIKRDTSVHFIKSVETTTNEDGRFEFNYLPADQPYAIYSVVAGSNSELVLMTEQFQALADEDVQDLGTLELIRSLQLAGRVELPEGHSLPKHARLTLGREPAWDLISIPIQEGGGFEIGSLPPETYKVRVAADGWVLDTEAVANQVEPTRFLLPLTESNHDLTIPLKAAKSNRTAHRLQDANGGRTLYRADRASRGNTARYPNRARRATARRD